MTKCTACTRNTTVARVFSAFWNALYMYPIQTGFRITRHIHGKPLSHDSTLFLRARNYKDRVAIIDKNGKFSYNRILQLSQCISKDIQERCLEHGEHDLAGKRVAFLCPQDVRYVAIQWAVWRSGGVAVPLCTSHPANMLEYYLKDSDASLLVTTCGEYEDKVRPLVAKLGLLHLNISSDFTASKGRTNLAQQLTKVEETESCWDNRDAMIVYTSGTTGSPKGVLTTHGNLRAQMSAMVKAWGWSGEDCILHVLPLHHLHGIVNVLACPLWVGASCVMMPKFQAKEVWEYLISSNPQLSLFMAVPTIYSKLIEYYKTSNHTDEKEKIVEKCQNISEVNFPLAEERNKALHGSLQGVSWSVAFVAVCHSDLPIHPEIQVPVTYQLEYRLMVSGSSALPEPVMRKWQEITGHVLLERYGMTEIGMALSNPLHGPRVPSSVGMPLPGVQVRITAKDDEGAEQVLVEGDENCTRTHSSAESIQGQLQVRGPAVFKSYWRQPEATRQSFAENSWFMTGDSVAFKNGTYHILGRSWDIIKSGGYKISALEVERELLAHPYIRDCGVLGVSDPVWGEKVAAVVSLNKGKNLALEELRRWASDRMIPYHAPAILKVVDELPRNTMGKVNKKELLESFFETEKR